MQLICSTFVHNKKQKRSERESEYNKSQLPFIYEVDSTAYNNNISLRRVIHELWFGLKAVRIVGRHRSTDILIGEPVFFVGWIFLIYSLVCRAKIKADFIDLWPEAITAKNRGTTPVHATLFFFLKLSRALRLRLYRDVSFVSTSYAKTLGQRAKSGNVFYWGSHLFPPETYKKRETLIRPLTIVYAGSFGEGYDIETVIDAAQMVAANPDISVKFQIAGLGTYRQMVEKAADARVVEYLGNLDEAGLTELYANSDVGLLPYKVGSMVAMPIKYFDYINFGLFCLSSLTLEAKEEIDERSIGISYKAGDSGDLYNKILTVARSPEILRDAKQSFVRLAASYAVNVQYKRFADWLEQ